MVNSISGDSTGGIQERSVLSTQVEQSEKVAGTDTAKQGEAVQGSSSDWGASVSTISDAAKEAYAKDKEILTFSRQAQLAPPSYNHEKVAALKSMVENGQIEAYLKTFNSEDLAASLLSSSAGSYIRS